MDRDLVPLLWVYSLHHERRLWLNNEGCGLRSMVVDLNIDWEGVKIECLEVEDTFVMGIDLLWSKFLDHNLITNAVKKKQKVSFESLNY